MRKRHLIETISTNGYCGKTFNSLSLVHNYQDQSNRVVLSHSQIGQDVIIETFKDNENNNVQNQASADSRIEGHNVNFEITDKQMANNVHNVEEVQDHNISETSKPSLNKRLNVVPVEGLRRG